MDGLQQLTKNVFVTTKFSDLDVGSVDSFVVTSAGIVMIDAPMLPSHALSWRDEIRKRGDLRYLLNTEYHMDHVGGNYFFREAKIIAHEGVRAILQGPVDKIVSYELGKWAAAQGMNFKDLVLWRYKQLDPDGFKLAVDYEPALPEITFTNQLTLHFGDHTFIMQNLPGHTPFNAPVYVPEEKVVFTGDNFTNNIQGSLAHSRPLEWLNSLKTIENLDVDYIVPGHGEVGDKKALRKFSDFVQGAINTVREAIKQGMSKEEAADKISFEKLMPPRHPGGEQQRMNVIRLYDVLTSEMRK